MLVKTPGGKFVALDPTQPIPLGSTIDTKHGTIQLTAQQKAGAKPQTAQFFDGIFKITQTKTTTDLTLNETLAKCPKQRSATRRPRRSRRRASCGATGRARSAPAASTAPRPCAARSWLVQDSCAGTLTQVSKGACPSATR